MAYRQHRPARPSALGAASPVLPPVKTVGYAQSYSAREHHHAPHTQQLETHHYHHHHQQEQYTPNQTRSTFASSPSHAHAHAPTTAPSTPNTTTRRARPRVTFASSPPSDYQSSSPLPLPHAPRTSHARGSGYSDRHAYGYGDRYGYSDEYGYGYEERYAPSERHALREAQIRTSPEIGADGALRGVGEWEEGSWGYRREYGYGYDYEKEMEKGRYSVKMASDNYTSYAPRSYSPAPVNTTTTPSTTNTRYQPQPQPISLSSSRLSSPTHQKIDIEAEYPPSSDFDHPDLHWDSEPASASDEVSPLRPMAGSGSASSSSASEDDERVISGDGKAGKMKMDGGDDHDDQDADEDGTYAHGAYGAYGYGYESGGYGPYESTRTTFFRVSAVRGQWRSDPRPPVLKGGERRVGVKAASVPVEGEAGVGLGLCGLGARTISEPAPATSGLPFLSTSGESSTSGTLPPTPVTPVITSPPAPVPSTSTATSPTTTTMGADRATSDKVGRINGFSSEDTSVSSPTAAVDVTVPSAASEDVSAAADVITDGAAAEVVIEVEVKQDPNPSEPDADADLPYNSPLTSSDTLPSLTSDDHERDSSSDPLDSYAQYHYGVDIDMPSSPLPPSSPPLPPSSSPVLAAYAFEEEEKERDVEMGMLDDDKMRLDGDVDMDMDMEVEEGMVDWGNTRGSSPLSEVPDEDDEEEAVPVVVKERSVSVTTSTARVPMEVARDVAIEEAPRQVNSDKPVDKISTAPKPKAAANDTANANAKGKTKAKLPSASAPLKDNNGAVREESVSVSVKKERVQVSLKKELKKEKEKEKVAGKKRRVEEDWDWEEENENEAEVTRVKPVAPVRKRKKQQEDRDRESSTTPSVAAASSSSTPPAEHPPPTKKPIKSRRANHTSTTTSSKSRTKRLSSSPPADLSPSDASIRPTDPETQALHAQVCGMLIQAMSTSRASSLPLSTLAPLVLQSQPALSSSRSFAEWVGIMDCVLHAGEASRGGSGVFGKVESSGAVDCGEERRRLEGRWFYVPELDEDQERAGVVRAMMPRPAKRSETKKYKQYYWRPLKKISMWDPEDAL